MEMNSIWEDFIKEVNRELKNGQIQTGWKEGKKVHQNQMYDTET